MRFAVIGCGVIGELHARTIQSLQPEAQLAAVVDVVPERARSYSETFGVASSTDLDSVLGREDVDAVTVCTPSGSHADIAVAALRAGKHVIIEKPIDVTLPAARRIMDAERESGATAMVVSQHRHDPASQLVHQTIGEGRFGRLTSGIASIAWWRSQAYYDSGDWRGTWAMDGGGALMNQGVHTLDLLVWFLGEPTEVFAWTGTLAHERIEVEDVATATIRFENGALATVHGTTAAYPGLSTSVGVYGDRGAAEITRNALSYYHVAPDENVPEFAYGAGGGANQAEQVLSEQPAPSTDESVAGLEATSHTTQFQDFLEAVRTGRPPLVTVAEATRTLSVLRGIYESARTGSPVRLKELER